MAQLKDTLVSGNLSVTDTLHAGGMNAFAVGTCNTAAATAAKVATVDNAGWQLQKGACIAIKYTYTNSASSPTLNVNNTGAKSFYYNNAVYTSNSSVGGYANRYVYYVYDGTYWVWLSNGSDNDTTYSAMSTAEVTAGTASSSRVMQARYLSAGLKAAIVKGTNTVPGQFTVYSQTVDTLGATASDNGKFLRVVNGAPAWVSIPDANGVSF